MTLSEWVAQHPDEIILEDVNRKKVTALLDVLAREITDAEGVPSDDGRLEHSFTACLAVARIALAACNYRLRSSAYHYLAVESLQYTIKLSENEVDQIQRFRRMRSRAVYEQVGIASHQDAQAVLTVARQLQDRLLVWLTSEHPDLLLM